MIEEYNKTALASLVDYNDPAVHAWADNVYEKIRQTGELPNYIERDKVIRQFNSAVDQSQAAPIAIKDNRFTFGTAYKGEKLILGNSQSQNLGKNFQIEFEFLINESDFVDMNFLGGVLVIKNNNTLNAFGVNISLPILEVGKLYKVKVIRKGNIFDVFIDNIFISNGTVTSDVSTVFSVIYEAGSI